MAETWCGSSSQHIPLSLQFFTSLRRDTSAAVTKVNEKPVVQSQRLNLELIEARLDLRVPCSGRPGEYVTFIYLTLAIILAIILAMKRRRATDLSAYGKEGEASRSADPD